MRREQQPGHGQPRPRRAQAGQARRAGGPRARRHHRPLRHAAVEAGLRRRLQPVICGERELDVDKITRLSLSMEALSRA